MENNLDNKVKQARWNRWNTCSLCEQRYHGGVWCALGCACWKTYLGRPETYWARGAAMNLLGSGLSDEKHYEEAVTVNAAELFNEVGETGEIIEGARGDMIVLDGDPLADIGVMQDPDRYLKLVVKGSITVSV